MKKREIQSFYRTLTSLSNVRDKQGDITFPYAVSRNIKLLKDEVESIDTLLEEYRNELQKIVNKFVKKDKRGNTIYKDGRVEYTDSEGLQKAIVEHDKKYKTTLDSLNKILEEEVEIELHKVDVKTLNSLVVVNDKKEERVRFSARDLEILEPMLKHN